MIDSLARTIISVTLSLWCSTSLSDSELAVSGRASAPSTQDPKLWTKPFYFQYRLRCLMDLNCTHHPHHHLSFLLTKNICLLTSVLLELPG